MSFATITESVRRYGRILLSRLGPHRVQLIFNQDYVPPLNDLYDQNRALKIISYVLDKGFLTRSQIIAPDSLDPHAIARFHSQDYLDSLTDEKVIEAISGQSLEAVQAEALLALQRAMVSGTMTAMKRAIDGGSGGSVYVNLGGGFHHAKKDKGSKLCVFNDIAIGIYGLRDQGWEGRVLILDLDLHQGDGTRRAFADDPTVMTLSVHGRDQDSEISINDFKSDVNIALGAGVGDQAYRRSLKETLPKVFESFSPDLVVYLAGVDIADDDPLGNWRITPDTILWRDQFVCDLVKERPFVWTLGGGYGPDAWRYTARSLAWLSTGLDDPIPSNLEVALEKGRRISQQLDPSELVGPLEDADIVTEEDIYGDLYGVTPGDRLFSFYSIEGIEQGLEKYGVFAHLRGLGFHKTKAEISDHHSGGQLLRLFTDDGQRELLIEAVLKEERAFTPYRLLSVEWLLMQNPRLKKDRPLLPGQSFPGLGCLDKIVLMLSMICERLDFDGLTFFPSHYHIAAFARGLLAFLNPKFEARFLAIEQALERVPMGKASWLAEQGGIVHGVSGDAVKWTSEAMVFAISERLGKYLQSAEYEAEVEAAMPEFKYILAENVDDN
ncbi:MAG: histone deacetylase [Planctomycetota bacterium]|nr:histone deacetylase [Planctomycetota bacterium]